MFVPPHSDQPERLDTQALSVSEVNRNLEDMARANRMLDMAGQIIKVFRTLLRHHPHDQPVYWLDLGSGGADVIPDVLEWTKHSGLQVQAIASDLNGQVLEIARENLAKNSLYEAPWVLQQDAIKIAAGPNSVDIVTCCHLFHHFSKDAGRELLVEMERVAKLGFMVIDLRRSWPAYWGTVLGASLLGPGHRLSRLDGPLSVLRAYEPAEIKTIVRQARLVQTEFKAGLWQWSLQLDKGRTRCRPV
jgi:SAM-dependent methyltransferase